MSSWVLALALFGTSPAIDFGRLVEPSALQVVADEVATDLAAQTARVDAARDSYAGKVTSFQREWLQSGKWEFIGVVERPDRRFNRPDLCGETRLLYRLRVKDAAMPAVINVVYEWLTTEPCTEFWQHRPKLGIDWARLEINLQTARWADDGKGRFVDQVRYLMRVFKKVGGKLEVAPLENTPDVERINADPILKAELSLWLADAANRSAIDRGFPQLPEKFLVTSAESVTPFGLERLANRPFKAIFAQGEFPEDLLRRLDTLTCVGCHQSAAVAGFHFLGKTHKRDGPALVSPHSAHFAAIQKWREASLTTSDVEPFPDPERLVYPTAGTQDRGVLPVAERDGDACEAMTLKTAWHPEDDVLSDVRLGACPNDGVCASTTNGFPGGLCSANCRSDAPGVSCVLVPTLGPFSACRDDGGSFESCLARHHQVTGLAACSEPSDCRADYACIESDTGGYCAPAYVLPHLNIEHH